jgi:hypothetical protein
MAFADPRLARLDGFRVEIDREHQRADVITGRRSTSSKCRNTTSCDSCSKPSTRSRRRGSSCCAPPASISPAAETSEAFLEASPEHVSRLAWNIAAPAQCAKPVIVASRGYCFGRQRIVDLAEQANIDVVCLERARVLSESDAIQPRAYLAHDASRSSKALASLRSSVSNPSVNQA